MIPTLKNSAKKAKIILQSKGAARCSGRLGKEDISMGPVTIRIETRHAIVVISGDGTVVVIPKSG